MDKISLEQTQKISYVVNTLLTVFVGIFTIIFRVIGADVLFYVTACALVYYLAAFAIIAKKRLDIYVFSVYTVITVFMLFTTVGLGIRSGFQMYVCSMIPLIFFFDYFAEKLGSRRVAPVLMSSLVAVGYFISTGFSLLHGPLYEVDSKVLTAVFSVNSMWVIGLLVFYSAFMVKLVRDSEKKLRKMAQVDKLTNLYNRSFMIGRLGEIHNARGASRWIAMLDIDHFKSINDTYGHNVGDQVLVKVASIIRDVCSSCEYARWGGEEFLIISDSSNDMAVTMETLRKRVDEAVISLDNQQIHVTVTIGACACQEGADIDSWIQRADSLMYQGKNSGRNRLILE